MSRIRILLSTSTNPWFNLAVEDVIFRNMPTDQRVLFLWRNADTVVIGRAQNPWRECRTDKMEADGVKLARRQTGGGAVFHDLGNTNFTFMAAKPEYDKSISTGIVLKALATLGIEGQANGRNDLVIEDANGLKKFSGSAYRETLDRGFHHGTLLLNADMSRLADYLSPDLKKLQAKGITSVKSRVINLNAVKPDIDHQQVCNAIIQAFEQHYDEHEHVQPELISEQQLPADLPELKHKYETQSSWDWNFGQTPPFSHKLDERFSWGGVEVLLDVEKGNIKQASIYTDMLDPSPLEALAKQLKDKSYQPRVIGQCVAAVGEQYPLHRESLNELEQWLVTQLS